MRNQQNSLLVFKKESGGYIALITILIISAVVLLLVISANLLSLGEAEMGLEKNQASEAYYLANACAEEALQEIRDSTTFDEPGGLSLGEGSCTYTVAKLTDQNRIITASGTVGTITRRLEITIDKIEPKINITSWQEVADFQE